MTAVIVTIMLIMFLSFVWFVIGVLALIAEYTRNPVIGLVEELRKKYSDTNEN